MPVTYRQLQAPVAVDTTLLETGYSEAAASLTRALKEFEGIALQPAAQLRAEQGAREGAQAGASGNPQLREGLRALTAYGQAYNNAAMRSYAIKAEADAEDTAARLEVEAQNDPEKFAALFGAVRDETIKQAPPQARGVLSQIYAQRLGDGVARLTRARAIEQNNLARADVQEGITRAIDRIATLRASDDPNDGLRAELEQEKLTMLIDGAIASGTISEIEGVAAHKKSQRDITAQTVIARFRRELTNPYGDPVGFIQKLKAANVSSEALPPDEEEKLVDHLLGELVEHNRLASLAEAESSAAVRARYEEGDREATALLLSGQLTTAKLREMVLQQRLDPGRATTLQNELQSGRGADIVDDPQEAFTVRTNLLSYSDEDIANNHRLSYQTRADLLLKKRELEQTWRSTQAAKEGAERIDRALGILPGFDSRWLPDEERRKRDIALTEWYDAVEALPPAERQGKVIEIANQIAAKYIRQKKIDEVERLRQQKADLLPKAIAQFGPQETWGEDERRQYEEGLASVERKLKEAEAEAARQ